MSESYEGIVFYSNEKDARELFGSLKSNLHLNLVRLAFGVFGVYRVAGRHEPFDPETLLKVARKFSGYFEKAIALFFDNGCVFRLGVCFDKFQQTREITLEDELWVLLNNRGKPVAGGGLFRVTELKPDEEYECVSSAIDLALESLGVHRRVSAGALLQAFCYDEATILATLQGG